MEKKYRKKPVVIEAVQWNGANTEDVLEFTGKKARAGFNEKAESSGCLPVIESLVMRIDTLEGTMTALPGDFIIKGIRGEFYPCKPDIFKKTYEEVEEEEI